MNSFLPFALPDIGEEEIAEVVDALRSGWLTTGPKTHQFEKEFTSFIQDGIQNRDGIQNGARGDIQDEPVAAIQDDAGGRAQALAVNSATAGLHLALEALGVGQGDEVITTPYTFTATAGVIRHLGADPVFVDIDPSTLNIDPEKIERAITPRTKVIMPVHFAGLACEMGPIIATARKHGLKIVEDAAHALPTSYRGRLIGSFGADATVYSFYATKTVTTGEGGMIVTRDGRLAERCRVMRLHGISRDAFDRYTSTKPAWHYEVIAPGFKYNMTDLAASIGIQQLKKAWGFQRRRAEMAARYDAELSDQPIIAPPRPCDGDTHSWHLYVIRLDDSARISRDEFIRRMSARGVGCSVHFIPLHLHPYWRDVYGLQPRQFPLSRLAYERAVSLPLYTRMTDADQGRVIEAVKDALAAPAKEERTRAGSTVLV